MYKSTNRFMQRDTRHELAVEKATEKDKKQAQKGRNLSESDKLRRANSKKAKSEREIFEAKITPNFVAAIGPLLMSINLKGTQLAAELNARDIKTPGGKKWNRRLAQYLCAQVINS